MKKLILASRSPRRIELMRQIGYDPVVLPSDIEEQITKTIPSEIVKELSEQKASHIARMISSSAVILGADTIVAADGMILGKPESESHAFETLMFLNGREHQVYTGVTLIDLEEGAEKQRSVFSVCTNVRIHKMTEEEINRYIATKEPMDKAGSYGIQGIFARHIEKIDGDYANVVGLPIAEIYRRLASWKIFPVF